MVSGGDVIAIHYEIIRVTEVIHMSEPPQSVLQMPE